MGLGIHFSCNVYDLPLAERVSERQREETAAAAKANNLSALRDVLEMGGQRFIGTLY